MKLLKLFIIVLITAGIINAQDKTKTEENPSAKSETSLIKTIEDSVSYSIGQSISANLKDTPMELNIDLIAKGMKDAKEGVNLLTIDQMKSCLGVLNQKMIAKRAEVMKEVGERNLKLGEEFLANNKKQEGVITTPSGLQYKVIVKGNGPQPTDTSTVKVNYSGKLLNGKEFDSSYKRGQPAEFPVNGVIKGWTEALKMMHVGDKWDLFIPADLAYGEQGAGGMIEPNSVLLFEVELLDIVKK